MDASVNMRTMARPCTGVSESAWAQVMDACDKLVEIPTYGVKVRRRERARGVSGVGRLWGGAGVGQRWSARRT